MGQCVSCTDPPKKTATNAKPAGGTSTSSKLTNGKKNDLPDQALESSFHAIKMLGQGTAGDIWLCSSKSQGDRHVAIKLFPRPFKHGSKTTLLREIQVPMELSQGCVSIVTAYEAILTPTHLALVMEEAQGGSLTSHIAQRFSQSVKGQTIMSEDEARYLFQQLIIAVAHFHKHGWAHRDVKLDNVLLTPTNPPELKLCDFGFAKQLDSPMVGNAAQTHLGTPEYMSPELLSHDKEGGRSPYNATTVDVWASGVMLVVTLLGAFPFDNQKSHPKSVHEAELDLWMQEVNQHWSDSEHIKSNVTRLSPECRDLLDKIFVVDPSQRITIPQIQAHAWYNQPLQPVYQKAAQGVAARQAELDRSIGTAPAQPTRKAERLQQLQSMVERACAGKGSSQDALERVDLTHSGAV